MVHLCIAIWGTGRYTLSRKMDLREGMASMIKNVVFDMGNVLLDYNPRYALEKYLDNEEDRALIERELFHGPEWEEADLGLIRDVDRYELVALRVPERLHSALKQIVEHWHDCMVPLPGAQRFVRDCKAAGYHVYILSNASDMFYHYFPNFCPLEEFDGYVVSCDVHATKPRPRIYRHLLNRYRLNPEECLFLDDLERNVEGAKAMGMQAVQFQNDFERLRPLLGL